MLLHDDEEEDDILCSVDVQRLDLPAVASSDFVVKTHDSNPILIQLRNVGASGIHREKKSREPCVWELVSPASPVSH